MKTGSNNHYSLISFNINGLDSPVKRQRLTDWIHKKDPTFCSIQYTHLSVKDKHYLKEEGWKTIFQANGSKKQARVAILIKSIFNQKTSKSVSKNTSFSSKEKSTWKNSQL
jgi:exonuclease III